MLRATPSIRQLKTGSLMQVTAHIESHIVANPSSSSYLPYENTTKVSNSSPFVYDASLPASMQIIFDDSMDAIFASIPAEQLDATSYYSTEKQLSDAKSSVLKRPYGQWNGSPIRFDDGLASSSLLGKPLQGMMPSTKVNRLQQRQYSTSVPQSAASKDNVEPPSRSPEALSRSFKPWERAASYRSSSTRLISPSKSTSHIRQTKDTKRSFDISDRAKSSGLDSNSELPMYSYLRPVGAIDSMRKTEEEAREEFLGLTAQAMTTSQSEIRMYTHRSPRVQILSHVEEMNKELKVIGTNAVLSFDMEWTTSKAGPGKTSVIQFASATHIFILQLGGLDELPKEVLRVLSDSTIIKCGVAISLDATKLRKDFGSVVVMANLVELSAVAKLVDASRWDRTRRLIALRDLCSAYLRRTLNKDPTVRQGPWANATLNHKQREYAASDVYVGLEILHTLAKKLAIVDGCDLFQQESVQKLMKNAQRIPSDAPPSKPSKEKVPVVKDQMTTSELGPEDLQSHFKHSPPSTVVAASPAKLESPNSEGQGSVAVIPSSIQNFLEGSKEMIKSIPLLSRLFSGEAAAAAENESVIVMTKTEMKFTSEDMHALRHRWQVGLSGSRLRGGHKLDATAVSYSIIWSLSSTKTRLNSVELFRLSLRCQKNPPMPLLPEHKEYLSSQGLVVEEGRWTVVHD